VGARSAGTAVGPTAVINSNGSGNDHSTVNAGDTPRAGSKLASANAYASELTMNESGSCIFGYHSSVTGYVFTPLANLKSCNAMIS